MKLRVGRWAVQLDRAGLVVLDLAEHRRREQAHRAARIRGRGLAFASVDDGGPGGSIGGIGSIAAMAATMPRRDEPVGFGLLHLREAHELGRRGRPLRG